MGKFDAARCKSSYSNDEGGACPEVADGCTGAVPVRDSENRTGPAPVVSAAAWRAFVVDVRA